MDDQYLSDNSAEIAELESILRTGVTTRTINGTTTSVDLNVVRQRLSELRRLDTDQHCRKPRVATIDLGGVM